MASSIHTSGMTKLGRYVQQRRAALGLRAEDVGARIGKSQSWLSRLETGALKTFPEPEDVTALAAVLQVTPRELLESAGYLDPASRDEPGIVNPFGVDDPRWELLETLKRYDLTAGNVEALTFVIMQMAERSRDN